MASSDVVVAAEVAEEEFKRLCAANRVEIPPAPPPPPEDPSEEQTAQYQVAAVAALQELAAFEAVKGPILKAIMKGTLIVGDDGMPTYTPVVPNPSGVQTLRFKKLFGGVFIAQDAVPREQFYTRLVVAASTLTGAPRVQIQHMEAEDFAVVCAVAQLFLSQG